MDDRVVDRRAFLGTLGLAAVPRMAGAQAPRTYRLAYVNSASETETRKPHLQALRGALADLGYVEGRNLVLDARFADGDGKRLATMVDDAVRSRPDVLLGFEDVAQLMRARTTMVPIVLTGALDPVSAGLAQSLAHPGTNVTGSTQLMDQLVVKHVELLRQILPRLGRIGQLVDTTARGCTLIAGYARDAADAVGAEFVPYSVATPAEIRQAFARIGRQRVDALLPCPSPILFSARAQMFADAAKLRIPFTTFVVADVPPGVLFGYAATIEEGYARAATYVDKILKGATPGQLPIEQPTRFRLVINLKTAKALGLTIPPSLLARADHVIE